LLHAAASVTVCTFVRDGVGIVVAGSEGSAVADSCESGAGSRSEKCTMGDESGPEIV